MKHVFNSHRALYDAWIRQTTTHGVTSRFGQRGELVFNEKLPQVLCVCYNYPIALRVGTGRFLIKSTVERLDYSTKCKIRAVRRSLRRHYMPTLEVLNVHESGDINDPDWLQDELVTTQALLVLWRDKASRARARRPYWIRLAMERHADFQKLMEWTDRKGVGEYELRKTMDDIYMMKGTL